MLEGAFWASVVAAGVRLASPILYAALGGLVTEKVGVLNVGLEGLMLCGAFAGAATGAVTGSAWVGLVLATLVGGMLGLMFAYLCIYRFANQVVVGLAFNVLALGLTGFLISVFTSAGDSQAVPAFAPLVEGSLADIPILGVLLQQTPAVLLGFALVPLVWFFLYQTNWGLAVRACGDDPESVDALGLNVLRLRFHVTVLGAMLAAAGGAVLSLSNLHVFVEGMTRGRGFLALAAYIFGRWTPLGTLLASLLFGISDAFQLRLQTRGVAAPYELMLALPYLLGLIALVGIAGKSKGPRAVAVPFMPDRVRRQQTRLDRLHAQRQRTLATERHTDGVD